MVYCAIILRIIRSAYINHFETPTNLNYVRPALASGSESLRLGEREVTGISYGCCIIWQVKSSYSCLISHVWARGIIKKRIPILWTLTLPWG